MLLIWMFIASAWAGDLPDSRVASEWSQTKLTSEWTHIFINNEKCASSADYRASCHAALEAAAKLAGQNRRPKAAFEEELTRLEELAKPRVPAQMIRAAAIRAHMQHFDSYADLQPTALLAEEVNAAEDLNTENLNVESRLLDDRTGYIRIREFGFTTCPQVRQHLDKLTRQNVRALVLDLRGNPGGEKVSALCVAEMFVGKKRLGGTAALASPIPGLAEAMNRSAAEDGAEEIVWDEGRQEAVVDWPMMVWIDNGSASSSEIVAAALHDNKRAVLVGEPSYGKAVAQDWLPLRDNPSLTLIWTSERIVGPLGRSHQGTGLIPDFALAPRFDRVSVMVR